MRKKKKIILISIILIILIISILSLSVFAFNPDGIGEPSILGHSGNEIQVNFRGETQTINQAINTLYNEAIALEGEI